VAMNPPYLGSGKLLQRDSLGNYFEGGSDLYASFIARALDLSSPTGRVATVSMRNWLYIAQYQELRRIVRWNDAGTLIADLDRGSFTSMKDIFVGNFIFAKSSQRADLTAVQPVEPAGVVRDTDQPARVAAGLLVQRRIFRHSMKSFDQVKLQPFAFLLTARQLEVISSSPSMEDVAPARAAQSTGNNARFSRFVWEIPHCTTKGMTWDHAYWVPFINGGKERKWIEPLVEVIDWGRNALALKTGKAGFKVDSLGVPATCSLANEGAFLRGGVAFTNIGISFKARVHRYPSVFANKGTSVTDGDPWVVCCLLNAPSSHELLNSLNPGIGFEAGDVNRLPYFEVDGVTSVHSRLEAAFGEHEHHRENSVEFRRPGPSPWRQAQAWAQTVVDRSEGAPLPPYEPEYDFEPSTYHLSFAIGVALGRFGSNGEGILDPSKDDLSYALPDGILFLDGTLDSNDHRDSLGQPAASILHTAWSERGATIDSRTDLRAWLRLKFFGDVHKGMYESRPIHWPLSSEKKTFVAWINIHRWNERTLRVLLADHLNPALLRIEGELNDLRTARDGADRKAARDAEKRFDRVQRWREELAGFIAAVEECAEKGPPPTDAKCPQREVDARYVPDLDDGVMINSAALWPLLEPQWKDPKKWWKELATAKERRTMTGPTWLCGIGRPG